MILDIQKNTVINYNYPIYDRMTVILEKFYFILYFLMLSVAHVREKYPQEYWDLSDQEVQDVLDFFYTFGYIMINNMTNKKPQNQQD